MPSNAAGLGAEGLDAEGLGAEGLDAEGLGAEGLDAEGLGAEGLDAEGSVAEGLAFIRRDSGPILVHLGGTSAEMDRLVPQGGNQRPWTNAPGPWRRQGLSYGPIMELTPDAFALGIVWYAAFLFSLTVHEAAHALAALKLGDETAYLGGQVTLNPLPHMQREPFGTVLVPLLSYGLAGWVMGWASAPYDPLWADRHPRRAAWMALAGPVSNLLIALGCGIAIRLAMLADVLAAPESATFVRITVATQPGIWEALATLLSILFSLNVLLFAFNLLPLPPLDGSGVLPLLLKESWAQSYQEFMRQPAFGLLGLIVAWNVFGAIYPPIHLLALNLLYPELGYH